MKRYKARVEQSSFTCSILYAKLVEDEGGEWVKYEEVQGAVDEQFNLRVELNQQIAAARNELSELRDLIKGKDAELKVLRENWDWEKSHSRSCRWTTLVNEFLHDPACHFAEVPRLNSFVVWLHGRGYLR